MGLGVRFYRGLAVCLVLVGILVGSGIAAVASRDAVACSVIGAGNFKI